jgi:ABC-type dipeptide/oligopeptide/nickel transport system permease component
VAGGSLRGWERSEHRRPGQARLAFIVRRLLATIPVLGMVALFVFLMLRLTPGDPAAIIAGLGRLTVDAVLGRDYPTIEGVVHGPAPFFWNVSKSGS